MSVAYKVVVTCLFGLGFVLTLLKAIVFFGWRGYKVGTVYLGGALCQMAMFFWTLAQ